MDALNDWIDSILPVAGSPWVFAIVFVLAMLDAILPVLPSESVVITFAVLSASGGEPNVLLLIAAAAAGAWAGDNLAYSLGRWAGPFAERKLLHGEKGRQGREKAEDWLKRYGGVMIVAGRYIPVGRTAVSVTAGLVRYPRPRFMLWDALAAVLWAAYSTLIGYWGGSVFKDNTVLGVLLGLGVALAITGIIEVVRRIVSWRRGARARSGKQSGKRPGERPGHEG